ncbi:MAG TPA: 4Fe-4S ferredoxin, partial [Halothiobacillaceae bacterium]|nr:4Fe-4S ferredoxin [Halothiobacillaceae bacterium]
ARPNGHFDVATNRNHYPARNLLLAIGRRGTPRKLDVPGEDLPKVTYRLIEPEQYRDRRVLVVGGGDSAVEAAVTLSSQPGTRVTLSYRRGAFSRIKPDNRKRIDDVVARGGVDLQLESEVRAITPTAVTLEGRAGTVDIDNDYTLVFAGGELPTPFLKRLGVEVETKFGSR